MSLYLWKPAEDEERQDGFRKHYINGEKVKHGFPTFLTLYGYEENPTPENYIAALKETWSNNWNVCFSQFAPPKADWDFAWRRKNATLENSLMDFMVLDFDGDHPLISCLSGLSDRVEAAKSSLPLLEGLEAVATYSSSAFFKNESNPNRMNLHLVIWLDKPSKRSQVRNFMKLYAKTEEGEKLLDPALSVKTQPHIVANPIFKNTEKLSLPGERVLHIPGKRLSLDELGIPEGEDEDGPETSVLDGYQFSTELTFHEEKSLRALVEKSNNGELEGGQRRPALINLLWTANFFGNGDTKALREAIRQHPKLHGSHDIDALDSHVRRRIEGGLTGGEFGGAWKAKKTIYHLDLADYDISELPTEKTVICLKSGCGSGKTKGFIKRLLELTGYERGLYVSALKATIEPAARDINFAYYLEHGEDQKADWCVSNDRVAITDKSLNVFFNRGVFSPFDIVFIDESERVAMNSVEPASKTQQLFELCKAAKLVVLLDADASCDLTGWFAEEIAENSGKELLALINGKDWMGEGHCVYELEAEKDVFGIMEMLLERGERVYYHTSRSDKYKRLSAIARHFQHRFPEKNIRAFDAETAPRRLKKEPNDFIDEMIETEGLDLLIVSPWSKIGWDYNGKHQFHATVGHYPHTHITAPDICQQMRRPRQTKKHYVWVGRRPPAEETDQRLSDLEKTSPLKKGQIKASFDGLQLAERAKEQKERQKRNIPYHLKMIVVERDAKYEPRCSTPRTMDGIRHLLTLYAEDELERDILERWDCPWKKRDLVAQFENTPSEWGDAFELNKSDLTFEDFRALYYRDINKRKTDITAVASIWFLEPSMRLDLDEEDRRFFAELTGNLLDEVDRIIRMFLPGTTNSFIQWLQEKDSKELRVIFTNEQFHAVKALMEECFVRYEHHIPWVEKSHKGDFVGFFSAMAEAFDVGFELLEAEGKAKETKHAIIRHYMEIKPGLIKPSKAKKIPKVNEKTETIKNILMGKLRKQEPLCPKEEAFMRHQGRLIYFYKHEYPHRAFSDELERASSEASRFFDLS